MDGVAEAWFKYEYMHPINSYHVGQQYLTVGRVYGPPPQVPWA